MLLKSLLLFVFALRPLFSSEVFESNELMQKIEAKETISGSSWELETTSEKDVLYKDGIKYSEKLYFNDGYKLIEGTRSERVILDSLGRIERKIIISSSLEEEYNYFYEDGYLSSYNYSINSEVKKIVNYKTSDKGRLLAFDSGDEHYLSDDFYVFTLDGKVVRLEENKGEDESDAIIESLDNGGYAKSIDGAVYTYSPEGRLISEKKDGEIILYSYADDGSLYKKETVLDSESTISYYLNGKELNRLVIKNGIVDNEKVFLDSGEIEEIRYLEGIPSYKIFYDKDGKRVKEIVKL